MRKPSLRIAAILSMSACGMPASADGTVVSGAFSIVGSTAGVIASTAASVVLLPTPRNFFLLKIGVTEGCCDPEEIGDAPDDAPVADASAPGGALVSADASAPAPDDAPVADASAPGGALVSADASVPDPDDAPVPTDASAPARVPVPDEASPCELSARLPHLRSMRANSSSLCA
jgi:hypothetical protein